MVFSFATIEEAFLTHVEIETFQAAVPINIKFKY